MRRAHAMVLCLVIGGCTDELDSTDTTQPIADQLRNGESLNGESLNGDSLGNALAWVSFKDVHLGNVHIDSLRLDGSELVGLRRHGWHSGVYRGTSLVGAELKGRSDTNKNLRVRIGSVVPPAVGADVWHYGLELKIGSAWFPMCLADALTGDGLNGPNLNGDELNAAIASGTIVSLPAIPLNGYWDYRRGVPGGGDRIESATRFTFACPKIGAIGKCVDAGYKPWDGYTDEHQSCVRLLRADYCGDGQPHTVNGTIVNVYDQVGVQDDTEDWRIEAEWDQDGALCVTSHLRQAVPVACYNALYDPQCGDPPAWDDGTQLVSELP